MNDLHTAPIIASHSTDYLLAIAAGNPRKAMEQGPKRPEMKEKDHEDHVACRRGGIKSWHWFGVCTEHPERERLRLPGLLGHPSGADSAPAGPCCNSVERRPDQQLRDANREQRHLVVPA